MAIHSDDLSNLVLVRSPPFLPCRIVTQVLKSLVDRVSHTISCQSRSL